MLNTFDVINILFSELSTGKAHNNRVSTSMYTARNNSLVLGVPMSVTRLHTVNHNPDVICISSHTERNWYIYGIRNTLADIVMLRIYIFLFANVLSYLCLCERRHIAFQIWNGKENTSSH